MTGGRAYGSQVGSSPQDSRRNRLWVSEWQKEEVVDFSMVGEST